MRLLKATPDICLLPLMAEEDRYGYELIGLLRAEVAPLFNDQSVYAPLLRLYDYSLIESNLKLSSDGPARK